MNCDRPGASNREDHGVGSMAPNCKHGVAGESSTDLRDCYQGAIVGTSGFQKLVVVSSIC
jgi:hypothetical protein